MKCISAGLQLIKTHRWRPVELRRATDPARHRGSVVDWFQLSQLRPQLVTSTEDAKPRR